MSRHLLIHIGMPKCGSTFLQRVLEQNREALGHAGVSYPKIGDGEHPGNGSGMHTADAAQLEPLFEGRDRLILSHEDLFSRGAVAQPLAQAAQELDVKVDILAFIRPFSQFVYGDYSQNMKQLFGTFLVQRQAYGGRDFETFAADRAKTLNPAMRFNQWRNSFEGQGFILRSHRDIRTTFQELYEGVSLEWEIPNEQSNPSLSMADCDELAAMINEPPVVPFVWENRIKARFKKAFRNAGSGQDDAGRTPERTIALEKLFERQNAGLLKNFNYDNRRP